MKNIYSILVLVFAVNLCFSQEDSPAIKKMKANAELTVEWLKKNIKISDEQAESFLSVLVIPKETIKKLSEEPEESRPAKEKELSTQIEVDFYKIFTAEQLEKYQSKKNEFGSWLEKKSKEKGLK